MTVAARGFTIGGLGEVAIRCRALAPMVDFYGGALGLSRLVGPHSDHIAFFKIAEGHAGHTTILALFADGEPLPGAGSSLHHIALSVAFDEQDAVMRWYEARGLDYRVVDFDWVGWRGVFTTDPEGNTVEIVARDPSVIDPPARVEASIP